MCQTKFIGRFFYKLRSALSWRQKKRAGAVSVYSLGDLKNPAILKMIWDRIVRNLGLGWKLINLVVWVRQEMESEWNEKWANRWRFSKWCRGRWMSYCLSNCDAERAVRSFERVLWFCLVHKMMHGSIAQQPVTQIISFKSLSSQQVWKTISLSLQPLLFDFMLCRTISVAILM